MYRILIVEDDYALAEEVAKHLTSYGYKAKKTENFINVIEEFNSFKPQLVLLDIMLPYKDGYWWCNEIRKFSSVPIVFMSSASDNMNIVMAINMGGDDFIVKPFESMVLIAKIQAVLRRTYEFLGNAQILPFRNAILNLSDNTLLVDNKIVELSKNEFRILVTLLENKGKIVTRDTLMLKLWQDDCYVEENTLTVNVGRLRKKLNEYGLYDVIQTKPGSGYIIND